MSKHRSYLHRSEAALRRLKKGELVRHGGYHHMGMALWKAEEGDPRPEGMTLSLINPISPSCYWGYHKVRSRPSRLSLCPDDYIWESRSDNGARTAAQIILMAQARILDVVDGEVVYR